MNEKRVLAEKAEDCQKDRQTDSQTVRRTDRQAGRQAAEADSRGRAGVQVSRVGRGSLEWSLYMKVCSMLKSGGRWSLWTSMCEDTSLSVEK